jgi:mRNA interferase RelE/StbE
VKVLFEANFMRDLKKIKDRHLLGQVQDVIKRVKAASSPADVIDLKKMQGHETFYRIRIGDHRIGLDVSGGEVVFVRFLHRKDIYRYFP